MPEDRRQNVLARIVDTPPLAAAVSRLQPELLHAVITHCGLADCGELLALTTVGPGLSRARHRADERTPDSSPGGA